ncbi:hypothetical protein FRB93_008717 [Tulasnella sp. JGI-2019a]|nr:hypothetical protein FRB93_008717 [Tulasnella sp. JGI-2019a]
MACVVSHSQVNRAKHSGNPPNINHNDPTCLRLINRRPPDKLQLQGPGLMYKKEKERVEVRDPGRVTLGYLHQPWSGTLKGSLRGCLEQTSKGPPQMNAPKMQEPKQKLLEDFPPSWGMLGHHSITLQYPSTEPLSLNSPPTPLPNTSDVASLKTPVGNESLEAVPVGGESSALAVDTHLTDVLPCILYAAWRLRRLMTFDQEGDPSKEATWRTPVDTLLDVVLSNNAANERCNLKMEVPISLPKSTAEDINVGDAIMDTGYFSYHIDIFQTAAYSKGGGMALLEKISVMPTPDTQRILILQLPCEYKQYFGEFQHGQLMYDLCAAQNQLKILGLTDETIYGIGCIKGVVDIKWSRWEHDHIKIGHVTTFDLRIPSQGVMFYRFLTLVQQDIIKRITTLESVTADQLRISGVEVTWKMDRMPPPGPSDSKRSRLDPHVGGTGGNRQYDAMDWSDSEEPEEEVEDDVDVVEVEERTRSWRDRLGDPLKNITKTPLMELPDQNGLAYIK